MTINPMDLHGPFIPFEKPVPAPTTDATDAPLKSVCFNEEWTPAVIGALKSLTRPETWQGTLADIERVSRSAHEILASDQPGCGANYFDADWYLDYSGGGIYQYDFFMEYMEEFNFSYMHFFVGFAEYVPLLGLAKVRIDPKAADGGFPVGIKIRDFQILQTGVQVPFLGTLEYKDCLGNTTVETFFNRRPDYQNFTAQYIICSANDRFTFGLVGEGNYLCTVA